MLECKCCGNAQDESNFYKHPRNVSGYDYMCKVCRKNYQTNLKKKAPKAPKSFNNTFKEIFGLE